MNHLFAFSSEIRAAAIAAGSSYGCGYIYGNGNECWYGGMDMVEADDYIRLRFQNGTIDNPHKYVPNIAVVLFSGRKDTVVTTGTMKDAFKQLKLLSSTANVHRVFDTNATHVWSLDQGKCACGSCVLDLTDRLCCDVNNCGYSLSGDILRRAYGVLSPRTEAVPDSLMWYPQWKFFPSTSDDANMMKWGLVYVPVSCRGGVKESRIQCSRVHIHYHGCIKPKWTLRIRWATRIDLVEYAEANDIMVIFPQVRGNKASGRGCWNWGFKKDDPMFDTKYGRQLSTVRRMQSGLRSEIARGCPVPVRNPRLGWDLSPHPPKRDGCGSVAPQ
eukprot:g1482.t1